MQVIITYKDRNEDGKREVDIIETDYRAQVEKGVLTVLPRDGDRRYIPLANIHEWIVR